MVSAQYRSLGGYASFEKVTNHKTEANQAIELHTVWFIRDTVKFAVWLSLGKF